MLSVQNLNFSYNQNSPVLKDISFYIQKQEKICLLGESGSGKSTILKIINAELQAASGDISFNHQKIKGPLFQLIPGHENIKYVPQNFQLDQYITVREIVGKYLSNLNLSYKKDRVSEVLEALLIDDLSYKKSHELSGGQKQRVAIARAIANPPKLLLLDEPFSQLDSSLHLIVRERLMQFLEENKIAVLFTTHSANDALGYADKIIVMQDGEIIQNDVPQNIYQNPESSYVCRMFGEVNLLDKNQSNNLQIPRNFFRTSVAIYPEEIKISENGNHKGEVKFNRYMGSQYLVYLEVNEIELMIYSPKKLNIGEVVNVEIKHYRWVN